jgi:ArsR family transcriptional regulator
MTIGLTENMNTDLNHNPQLDTLAQTFKALSEPVRLRIIHLLMQRDSLCVCDLVSVLELNQSTVSRHLSYLKNAGIVTSWREGTWMHYALEKDALQWLNLPSLNAQFNLLETLQNDLQGLLDYERAPRSCTPPVN